MSCPGKYIKSFHFHLSSLIHKHFTYRFLPLGTWLCSSYVSFGKGNQTKRQRFYAYVTLLLPWDLTIFWWLEQLGFVWNLLSMCLLKKTVWWFFYCQKVDYPLELDVYEFCSDELKQKLQAPRQVPFSFCCSVLCFHHYWCSVELDALFACELWRCWEMQKMQSLDWKQRRKLAVQKKMR